MNIETAVVGGGDHIDEIVDVVGFVFDLSRTRCSRAINGDRVGRHVQRTMGEWSVVFLLVMIEPLIVHTQCAFN